MSVADLSFPIIAARHYTLRPVSDRDYATLFRWRTIPEPQFLMADTGTTNPQNFARWMEHHRENGCILLIENRNACAIGYVATYGVDLWNGSLYYASYIAPEFRRQLYLTEVLPLCAQFLFYRFPLRKLFVEVYESASRLRDYLVSIGYDQEGFMGHHVRVEHGYMGVWTLSLARSTWEQRLPHRPRLLTKNAGIPT